MSPVINILTCHQYENKRGSNKCNESEEIHEQDRVVF